MATKKQIAYLKIEGSEMYWEFVGLNNEKVRRFGPVDFDQLRRDIDRIEANILKNEVSK